MKGLIIRAALYGAIEVAERENMTTKQFREFIKEMINDRSTG